MRICRFLKIVPSYLSLVTRHRKHENFDIMTSFDPLKCVLGGLNLHPEEFLCTYAYLPPKFCFWTFARSRDSSGNFKAPRAKIRQTFYKTVHEIQARKFAQLFIVDLVDQ